MLIRACCLVGLAAAAFAGCGDDPPNGATSPTVTAAAPPTAKAIAGQDKLPERPQVALDFRKATKADVVIDPPAQGRIAAGALNVKLREAGAARAAPRKQPPDDVQTVLAIARIADPRQLDGRAGIFCRGDGAGNGYELTIDRAGAVRLDRVAGGRRTTLAHGQARLEAASPPDSPVPLFLVCGRGDEAGPNVVFTAGAQEAAGVRDPSPLPPGSGSRAGMVVDGKAGDSARFTVFTLTYGP